MTHPMDSWMRGKAPRWTGNRTRMVIVPVDMDAARPPVSGDPIRNGPQAGRWDGGPIPEQANMPAGWWRPFS